MTPCPLVVDAGHLPAAWVARQPQPLATHTLTFAAWGQSVAVQVPALSPEQLADLAVHVRTRAAETIKRMSVADVIHATDRVIARLLDTQDPVGQSLDRCLPVVSGFDADMVRLGLGDYLKTFRAPQLWRFVAGDFANPQVLDGFQPRAGGGWTQAMGPELMVHIWAGNVPGLPLWSLISGLLVKAGSVGKVSSSEPVLAGLFARLLAEVEPRLADVLAVVWWRGGDEAQERALLAEADVVLAYGGNGALEPLKQRVPVTTRFLPHGHKLSVGLVSATALTVRQAQAVVRQAALDVARWDQQGCYSPQQFYVERGGRVSPREWAQMLTAELAALQHKFARRALPLDEAATVAAWRQTQEMRSLQATGVEMLGDASAPCGVVYADTVQDLSPCALNRTVQVVAVDRLDDVLPRLAEQRAYLQTVGLAASPEVLFHIAPRLGAAGVTRICAIGAMTAPQAGWHHDGGFSLLDLVRMVDIEASAEQAAEAFAAYRD